MNPRRKVQLVVLTLVVVAVALATVYLNRRIVDMQRREADLATSNRNTPPPQRPLPHQEKYSRTAFIMNRDDNTKPGSSVYSDVAQIRGKVRFWVENKVTVDVAGDLTEVQVPDPVRLYCGPEFYDAGDGQSKIPARDVFADLFKADTAGKVLSRATVAKKIPSGQDINMRVNVGANNAFTADIIMGYGCAYE